MNNRYISWFEFYTLLVLLLFGIYVFFVQDNTRSMFFYNKKGVKAFQKGDYEQAYKYFYLAFEKRNLIEKKDFKSTYGYINLALCHDRLNDPEEAMFYYDRGITHNARNAPLRYDDEKEVFVRLIPKQNLLNSIISFNLGELYGRMAWRDMALNSYQEALYHPDYRMRIKKNIELLLLNPPEEKSSTEEQGMQKENSEEKPGEEQGKEQGEGLTEGKNQSRDEGGSEDSDKGDSNKEDSDSGDSDKGDSNKEDSDRGDSNKEDSNRGSDRESNREDSDNQPPPANSNKSPSSTSLTEPEEEGVSKSEEVREVEKSGPADSLDAQKELQEEAEKHSTGDEGQSSLSDAEANHSSGGSSSSSKESIDKNSHSVIFEEIGRRESEIKKRLYRKKKPFGGKTKKDW